MERRQAAEWRLDARRLEGLAAPYNSRTTIADFTEAIAPGAFAGALRQGADVVALVDHDPGRLLARTRSGTLQLRDDARGLMFALEIPDTQLGRDIAAMVTRGDVGGCSIGFRVPKGGDEWQGRDRTLRRVDLVDVSIVQTFPAYADTYVSTRMRSAGVHGPISLLLAQRMLDAM
ncbi:MAG: HK97 family phage prohead protease [Alphaproteobacteria bacterium]|nr:HK97 family phage prohead protease [Alphaproteobacteria bacterium]